VSRATYNLAIILLSWLLMQVVHEAGHVLAGLCVGDRIERVVLHPLTISRTELSPGRNLLLTTAAGPVFGSLVPLLLWLLGHACRLPSCAWLRFFAGFCLIANGAYLGVAIVEPVGDAELLLLLGTPAWVLFAFGVVTIPAGLMLWHRLSPEFGWGTKARAITGREAASVLAVLLLVVALEMAFSPR